MTIINYLTQALIINVLTSSESMTLGRKVSEAKNIVNFLSYPMLRWAVKNLINNKEMYL